MMKTLPPPARPWRRQAWPWLLLGLSAGLLLTGFLLDPLAAYFTRRGLNQLSGYRGEFRTVHVSLWHPSYRIEGLKITRAGLPKTAPPLLYIEQLEAFPIAENLLQRELTAVASVDGLRIEALITEQSLIQAKLRMNRLLPELSQALRRIIPIRIQRLELHDAEVFLVDAADGTRPPLQLDHLDATLENFASRRPRSQRPPIVCAVHMRVQHSGDFSLFLVADSRNDAPTFAGQVELHEMPIADVHKLIVPHSPDSAPSGIVDIFMSFKSARGVVTGGVRPLLVNVQFDTPQEDLITRLRTRLEGSGLDLFANQDLYGENRPTVLPIRGKLAPTNSELWPTVSTVISNSFAQGLLTGLAGIPPKVVPARKGGGRKCCVR